MTISFRPAVREATSLLIGISGASGGGKTMSALRLARGIVGPTGKIAVIDTEAGRALHYAGMMQFDHAELKPPFRPSAYLAAIKAADAAGYGAIVIDSMSHEHRGPGGVLDWHEEEVKRMAGDDWQKAEKVKFAAWIKPKGEHKRFIEGMLQTRATLIFCLRAEPKIGIAKDTNGKTLVIDKGYQAICDGQFLFEMTCSFLLTPDAPGIPKPIKLQDQHKHCFPEGKQIGEESGRLLAAWARGESAAKGAEKPDAPELDPTVLAVARDVASLGADRFREHWKGLSAADRAMLKPHVEDLKSRAEKADNATQKERA